MAASRSMLESLLARVRQRATEPRAVAAPAVAATVVAREASAAQEFAPAFAPPVAAPPPAPVAALAAEVISAPPSSGPALETSLGGEEEVEEYDAELIEILDDEDVASEMSESSPEESPIELRASLPSVEVRRRAQSSRPPPSRPAVAVVAPPLPAAALPLHAAASVPLHAEAVARRPVAAGAVVQSPAPRPETRSMSFVDLLDASLKLGR